MVKMLLDLCLDKSSVLNCLPFSEVAFQTFQAFSETFFSIGFAVWTPEVATFSQNDLTLIMFRGNTCLCSHQRPHRLLAVHCLHPVFTSI